MSQTWEFTYIFRGSGGNEQEALVNALDNLEASSSKLVEDEVHPIQRILETNRDFDCRSYSGRGMCDKYCLAVTAKSMAEVASYLIRNCDEKNQQVIADALELVRSDRLGLGMVFYFPQIEYVDEEHEAIPEDIENA